MPINSRAKGGRWEAAVRDYFKSRGWHCTRHYQRLANNDAPDLTAAWEHGGVIRVVRVECKSRAQMSLKDISDALAQAASSAGPGFPVAVVKRPRLPVADAIVCVELGHLADCGRDVFSASTQVHLRLEDFAKLVES
jgi:Holliday junction resolvase